MTFSVKKPTTLLFSLFLSIATIAIMGSTAFADDYDADTVDVIDIENLPWGTPNQQEAATEKSTEKNLSARQIFSMNLNFRLTNAR